jgi:hypothetical protein
MSPEELRNKRKRLNRALLIRDSTVWAVCLFEIGWFVWIFIVVPQLVARIGSVLIIFGMAFMNFQVWLDQRRRRQSLQRAEASGNINSLDFFRSELVRQREFHRGLWFWSRMAALYPGLLVFGIGASVVFPWPDDLVGISVTSVAVILFPLATWLNLSRSRNYQRQIEALDALKLPPA